MSDSRPAWQEWRALFTDKRPWEYQVWSGFFLALGLIIGFVVFMCLLIGLELLFFPRNTRPDYFLGRHPFSAGTSLVVVATVVMFATVRRWTKVLPGFIGYGVLGGEIIIITGNMENSSIPVSRWVSIPATAFCILIALAAKTVADRDLRLLDQICLVAFVYGLVFGAIFRKSAFEFIAPVSGALAIVLAWAVDRYLRWQDERPDYHLVHGNLSRPPVRR